MAICKSRMGRSHADDGTSIARRFRSSEDRPRRGAEGSRKSRVNIGREIPMVLSGAECTSGGMRIEFTRSKLRHKGKRRRDGRTDGRTDAGGSRSVVEWQILVRKLTRGRSSVAEATRRKPLKRVSPLGSASGLRVEIDRERERENQSCERLRHTIPPRRNNRAFAQSAARVINGSERKRAPIAGVNSRRCQ